MTKWYIFSVNGPHVAALRSIHLTGVAWVSLDHETLAEARAVHEDFNRRYGGDFPFEPDTLADAKAWPTREAAQAFLREHSKRIFPYTSGALTVSDEIPKPLVLDDLVMERF